MKISDKGIELIKHFEGCKLSAYRDPVGIFTIGYGTTRYSDGRWVHEGHKITQKQAEQYLKNDVEKFEKSVNEFLKIQLKQCQFDSLVSFAYNLGAASLLNSTLLREINNNPFNSDIQKQFERWNHAGGQVIKGLTLRRKAEAWLYFNDELKYLFT